MKKFQKADDALSRKKFKKTDLIDSFIEGDLKLNDVLTRMNESKAAGGSRQAQQMLRDNKRISEMFRKSKRSISPRAKKAADNHHNQTGLFTLKDFINDVESVQLFDKDSV